MGEAAQQRGCLPAPHKRPTGIGDRVFEAAQKRPLVNESTPDKGNVMLEEQGRNIGRWWLYKALRCLALAVVVTCGMGSSQTAGNRGNGVTRLSRLERLEKQVEVMPIDSPDGVRTVVNQVVREALFGCESPWLQEELFKAEWRYLNASEQGVEESKIPTAINNLAHAFRMPNYSSVTEEQVRGVRRLWEPMAPRLLMASNGPGNEAVLSPLGGAFLGLAIIYQKVSNPIFQQTAGEFLATIGHVDPSSPREIRMGVSSPPALNSPQGVLLARMEKVLEELNTRNSSSSRAVLEFFTELWSRNLK